MRLFSITTIICLLTCVNSAYSENFNASVDNILHLPKTRQKNKNQGIQLFKKLVGKNRKLRKIPSRGQQGIQGPEGPRGIQGPPGPQ